MIRPIKFNADGTVEVWHDERQHGGVVANIDTDAAFHTHPILGLNPDYIDLPCPVPGCGSVSTHPISGGGAPEKVQELFIRKLLRSPEVIPGLANLPTQANARRPLADVKAFVKQRGEALDQPGRFKLDAMNSIRDV